MFKRIGDTTKISGDYQYKALTEGNPVQRFWHYSKQLAISRFLPPRASDYIIDAGCGSGVITSFLGESGATILGIDGSKDAIQFAREKYSKPNVNFIVGLVDNDLVVERSVDKIYCLEVIEHIFIDQAKNMLHAFHKVLKPEAKVFISTPNYRSMWPIIEYCMDFVGAAPQLKYHQHVEFYHRKTLEKLCRDAGFEVDFTVTTCLFAPWLALLSWKLALHVNSLEYRLPFYKGSILNCILSKRT